MGLIFVVLPIIVSHQVTPVGNRLYKYELDNNRLVNPKILLDLPRAPAPTHNGLIKIGLDNNLYVVMGDLDGYYNEF